MIGDNKNRIRKSENRAKAIRIKKFRSGENHKLDKIFGKSLEKDEIPDMMRYVSNRIYYNLCMKGTLNLKESCREEGEIKIMNIINDFFKLFVKATFYGYILHVPNKLMVFTIYMKRSVENVIKENKNCKIDYTKDRKQMQKRGLIFKCNKTLHYDIIVELRLRALKWPLRMFDKFVFHLAPLYRRYFNYLLNSTDLIYDYYDFEIDKRGTQ